MRIALTLKATDLETGQVKVLADGPAILHEETLIYVEKDTGARHRVRFGEEVIIERSAEVSSRTVLREGGNGESVVSSPYGDMKLVTKCKMKTHSKTAWIVEYSVFSGDEQVLEQRLEWNLKPFS